MALHSHCALVFVGGKIAIATNTLKKGAEKSIEDSLNIKLRIKIDNNHLEMDIAKKSETWTSLTLYFVHNKKLRK